MNVQKILAPLAGLALLGMAWYTYGWGGLALVSGGILMWVLLQFNRTVHVLRKAKNRPIGYVGSAVMLNAKLKKGLPLLHVIAITQALGERLSPEGEAREVLRWTDGSQSHVTCDFVNGKLVEWTLVRPTPPQA
jgi:hypothetical protein